MCKSFSSIILIISDMVIVVVAGFNFINDHGHACGHACCHAYVFDHGH